jgi:NTE family protein
MRISEAAAFGPVQPSWADRLLRNWRLTWSPAFVALDLVTRLLSPYEFNPLKDVLGASMDFATLRPSLLAEGDHAGTPDADRPIGTTG